MTNENMVRRAQVGSEAGANAPGMPEPNPTPPTRVPAPESDPQLFVTHDPIDSPQLKQNIKQNKTQGLKAE